MIIDQDFPGNVTIAVLSRSLKERFGGRHNNEQSCQKQRKKPAAKDGKTGKCAEERDNESRYSFQNYDSRQEPIT